LTSWTRHENTLPSGEELDEYFRRRQIVDGFRDYSGSKAEYAREKGIGRATFYRYLADAKGGQSGLFKTGTKPTGRPVEMPGRAAALCFCYAERYPKATKAAIHREVSKIAKKLNIGDFTPRQVRLLFQRTPKDLQCVIAEGEAATFNKYMIVARRESGAPLASVQCDSTVLDVWTFDESSGKLLKVWITLAIDTFSRVILAAAVHRDDPNAADALIALERTILPKGDKHPFCGIMEEIATDNHRCFKSDDFLDALRRLDITWKPGPKGKSAAQGKVERSFSHGMMMDFAQNLEPYTKQPNGLWRASKRAVPMTLVPRLLERFILRHNLRKHSALKDEFGNRQSPWERWMENADLIKRPVIDPKAVKEAIKLRREVNIWPQDGVELSTGRHYNGPCMAGLVGEPVVLLISPEGRDRRIPVYHKNLYVGEIGCVEDDPMLAGFINKGRLARLKELRKVRRLLRETLPPSSSLVRPTPQAAQGLSESYRDKDKPMEAIPELPAEPEKKED